MNSSKNKKKVEKIYIISGNEHPSILKMATFLQNIFEEYDVSKFNMSSKNKIKYIVQSLGLLVKIRKNKVDIVIMLEPWYPSVPFLALRLFKAKIVYWSGNINYDILRTIGYSKVSVTFFKRMEESLIRKSSIIMSDSISFQEFFRDIASSVKTYYVPEYVLDGTKNLTANLQSDVTSNNKYITNVNIGYISSMQLERVGNSYLPRGWELVYVAKQMLELNVKNFKIIVIGAGSGLNELKHLAQIHEVISKFEFTGYVNDKEKLKILKTLTIGFCEDYKSYLTHRYNLGVKIQEYLQSRVPVVTGNQGDKGIIVGNNKCPCGICISPLDDFDNTDYKRYVSDITNAIMKIILNIDLHKHYADCCIKISNKYFLSKTELELKIREIFKHELLLEGSDRYD